MRTTSPGPSRLSFLLCAHLCACAGGASDATDGLAAPDDPRPLELQKPLHNVSISIADGHAVTYRAYADGALIIGDD